TTGWTGDLNEALTQARAHRERTGGRKLVFIDFTGETCTNCKINEQSVFSKPEFEALLSQFQRVKLFTDKVPTSLYPPSVRGGKELTVARQRADADVNLNFQRAKFGTEQLPLYVILDPVADDRIEVVGVYDEGKINDEAAFAQFLNTPLNGR